MFNFFKNGKKLKEIQKRLIVQKATIDSYITELDPEDRKRIEWCTVHGRECQSTGLLMWEKDLNHKYTFLNSRHCNDFFHISLADVRDMVGKTDVELIEDFNKRTGLNNTFGPNCLLTDKITITNNKICRFWEMGYIGDKLMLLDVTKTPIRDLQGNIVGVSSWALNQSNKECEVKTLLEIFLNTGEAKRVDVEHDGTTACYLIHKKDNPFNGVFPK